MTIERTLAIVKPDAWPKHGGAIITLATEAGLVPVKMCVFKEGTTERGYYWRRFYAEHRDRPFFPSLVEFMASGPSLVMVLESKIENACPKCGSTKWGVSGGHDGQHDTPDMFVCFDCRHECTFGAVARWRALMGPTDSRKAPPTTIRNAYGYRGGFLLGPVQLADGRIVSGRDVPPDPDYPMWRNAVHGSDSAASAEREIKFFFGEG